MSETFDDYFEKGTKYCIWGNNSKAYECFSHALRLNFDVDYFWSKIILSDISMRIYENFFHSVMDDILFDLESNFSYFKDKYGEWNIKDFNKIVNYVYILNKCLLLSSKANHWAKIYQLFGDIYILLNNEYLAYEYFKLSLYFNKTKAVTNRFRKLAVNYGLKDKISNNEFNYSLLNNIHFKTLNKNPCTQLKWIKYLNGEEGLVEEKINRITFALNNNHFVPVEGLVIDYYNKKGYKAYHDEGKIINFLSTVLFKDINEKNIKGKSHVDLIKNRVNEFNEENYYDLILKYYKSNILGNNYNSSYYPFDYIGYDEWINIIKLIGIKECLNYVGKKLVEKILIKYLVQEFQIYLFSMKMKFFL